MSAWADLLLLFASAVPSTAFCVYYAIVAPWWRSAAGINLFGFTACIAILFDLSLALRFTGPFPGLTTVSVIVYGAIAVFLWQRLWLLLRANRHQ